MQQALLTNEKVNIMLPSSVYSNESTINALLRQFSKIGPLTTEVIYNTANMKWIDGEVSSLLGSLFEKVKTDYPHILQYFVSHITKTKAEQLLIRNGLLPHYLTDFEKIEDSFHTVIAYKVIDLTEDNAKDLVFKYLNDEVYSHSQWKSNFSVVEEQAEFSDSIFELVSNVLEHSRSSKILISGQFYPKKDEFRISIGDIGIGIPVTVQNETPTLLSDGERIDWATHKSMTSKTNAHARGLGLHRIKESLTNVGTLIIVSGTGYWKMNEDGFISHSKLSYQYPGTYVKISFSRNRIFDKMKTNDIMKPNTMRLPF